MILPRPGHTAHCLPSSPRSQSTTVPDVMGMTAAQANKALANAGFNIHLEGALNGSGAVVMSQSLPKGTVAAKGTVITVDIRHTNFTD